MFSYLPPQCRHPARRSLPQDLPNIAGSIRHACHVAPPSSNVILEELTQHRNHRADVVYGRVGNAYLGRLTSGRNGTALLSTIVKAIQCTPVYQAGASMSTHWAFGLWANPGRHVPDPSYIASFSTAAPRRKASDRVQEPSEDFRFVRGENLETPADALRILRAAGDGVDTPTRYEIGTSELRSSDTSWNRWSPVREGFLTAEEAGRLLDL